MCCVDSTVFLLWNYDGDIAMDGIRSAGLLVCILMVLMAYLKQMIPKGKTTFLMKAIISLFILLSIVQGLFNINWRDLESLFERVYTRNDDVWEQAADSMEDGLKSEFNRYLEDEDVDAWVTEIEISSLAESFSIDRVQIYGSEQDFAAKLLAGRYMIDLEKIEVTHE